MISLPTVFERRLRKAAPNRTAWIEAWGFFLAGLGVYLVLACYTYTPYDYTAKGLNPAGISNLAGPIGAYAAKVILGLFGVMGLVWPLSFIVWGILTATGFVMLPKPRRFLGMFAVTSVVAGFAEMQLPVLGLVQPSFGFGGKIGAGLKHVLSPQFGFGGTLVALAIIGIISLVLTRNLKLSSTAEAVEWTVFYLRRWTRKAWIRYVLNKDVPQELSTSMPITSKGQRRVSGSAEGRKSAPRSGESGSLAEGALEAQKPIAKVSAASAGANGLILELYYDGPASAKPEIGMFSRTKKASNEGQDFSKIAKVLTEQLAEFKISGTVEAVTQGAVVTTFEFKPAPGTKVSKIAALGEDLARLLKAPSLRVLAPIPGKDTVGFEVPNSERAIIGFGDLIDCNDFRSRSHRLPIAMGIDIFGKPVVKDLADMPHLLVAGSTGAGKSVFMNTLIGSLINRHSPRDLRFVMIDPKMVEMAAYNSLPHMACPVITDPKQEAKAVLDALILEMDQRYNNMKALGARNIESFNEVIKTRRRSEFVNFDGRWLPMPYIVVIIDEMADIMMTLGKEAEMPITRLAQKARAAGIHMVIATQRPSADVITGLLKANFPTRVAFRVMSSIDSRTILDQAGAETLLGKGDMLYLASGGMQRLHGAYLSEKEVQTMVAACNKRR